MPEVGADVDAGVVDQNIEFAVIGGQLGDEGFDRLGVGHIQRMGFGLARQARDFVGGCFGGGETEVSHKHKRTLGRERNRDGLSNSCARSRDERDFAGEPFHSEPPKPRAEE